MRDIAARLLEWHAAGKDYAVACLLGTGGFAPRPLGAALAVDADGTVVGSIGEGPMEAAIAELCRESLRTGRSMRETVGTIQVFVQSVTEANRDAVELVLRAEGEAVALVRDLDSGAVMALGTWWTAGAELDERVVIAAQSMLDAAASGVRTIGRGADAITVFVQSQAARQVFGMVAHV
ncbi:XdhC family protein [Nocardia sp. CDC153]|uniref:XdhC family protein n=1 Tax=Nocardia sp. CDC153 TaxID=3112167 RepID=UPI002DB67509|nr:XdhC family protein [Nocardia sp. CDC153]MEC3953220.1 XdhC family protein [Nocardia sp. CDC153]